VQRHWSRRFNLPDQATTEVAHLSTFANLTIVLPHLNIVANSSLSDGWVGFAEIMRGVMKASGVTPDMTPPAMS
jgi:hypothetical protein